MSQARGRGACSRRVPGGGSRASGTQGQGQLTPTLATCGVCVFTLVNLTCQRFLVSADHLLRPCHAQAAAAPGHRKTHTLGLPASTEGHPRANVPSGGSGSCGWPGGRDPVILVYYTVLISDNFNLNLFKKNILYKLFLSLLPFEMHVLCALRDGRRG